MLFNSQSDLEQFLINFIASSQWTFIEDLLKDRGNTILGELAHPATTSDGRAMLTGRLLEVEWVKKTPVNAARFYSMQQQMKQPADEQQLRDFLKTVHPDIITH